MNDPESSLAEAEALIWALLDDRLEAADAARLSKLVELDAAVRALYIDCVQLHVDLSGHFDARAAGPKSGAVILPDLLPGAGLPGVGSFPQISD